MASDSISARYDSYRSGLALVDPQIKGCINKINDDISPDLKAAFVARLAFLQERKAKIVAARTTQDAAEAASVILEDDDNFPALPPMEIAESLLLEISEEGAADDAAAAGFASVPQASTLGISLGMPVDKP